LPETKPKVAALNLNLKRRIDMFKSFDELARFGEGAREVLVKSIVRWAAAAGIAALWMQTFLHSFLPVE
jgi:hypothetical protein